ncbi:MAG TPA: MerR family transcriptional regulator [Thermomicrobiales bacterium]|nr:MerR family transcriptional regulator [Thermomicrobiales bacterium]
MIDDQSSRFTLAELEDASGVSGRTIRFYISNQLVSPAHGRGRSRYFTPNHLRELEYVATLREKHFSIDEIRERMAHDAAPAATDAGEQWERFELRAGLELLVRGDVPDNVRALARELRSVARDWFGDDETGSATGADVQLNR